MWQQGVTLDLEHTVNTLMFAKPPLEREELRDVVDIALWAGQLLLQHGAEAERIEETVHHLATGLGCDWADIFISSSVIAMTTHSGGEFRTSIRRVTHMGVNKTTVAAVNRLSRKIAHQQMDRFEVRAKLEAISTTPHQYNRWVVVVMVGLACASFSRLFGGDWAVFGITWLAASMGMYVRQELTKRHFNAMLVVVATAFIASLTALSAVIFHLSPQPETAVVASVLLLVPGVPLVNAFEDLIKGYWVIGMARAAMGTQVLLSIAVGILLALFISGVGSL